MKPIKIKLDYLEYEDLRWMMCTGLGYVMREYPEQVNAKSPNDISIKYKEAIRLYRDIRNQHG